MKKRLLKARVFSVPVAAEIFALCMFLIAVRMHSTILSGSESDFGGDLSHLGRQVVCVGLGGHHRSGMRVRGADHHVTAR